MSYYERDEARHIGLGVQLVPQMVSKLSIPEAVSLALFQLDLLSSTLFSLKTIEQDLVAIGVDPRSMLGMAFRKQADIDTKIRAEFAQWPEDPPLRRVFEGVCEALFPSEGADANVPTALRMKHAVRRHPPHAAERLRAVGDARPLTRTVASPSTAVAAWHSGEIRRDTVGPRAASGSKAALE